MDKELIQWISTLTRKEVILLPKSFLKMCYNEYLNQWRKENKDKWNAIRRENSKKYRNNITKGKIKVSNNITPSIDSRREHE